MDSERVPEDTAQCSYEAVHRRKSISVYSKVPGFTDPTCFVSKEDSQDFDGRFVYKLLLIARSAKRNMQHRFRLIERKCGMCVTEQRRSR